MNYLFQKVRDFCLFACRCCKPQPEIYPESPIQPVHPTTNTQTELQTYRHADWTTDLQTRRLNYRPTDTQTELQTYRHADWTTDTQTELQTYRHADWTTDLQTRRLNYRPTDTQTELQNEKQAVWTNMEPGGSRLQKAATTHRNALEEKTGAIVMLHPTFYRLFFLFFFFMYFFL